MRFRAFKRIDQQWSITDQDTGQTLSLVLPNEQIANLTCVELNNICKESYKNGYADGKAGR